jgi:hypothetical protein
VNAGDCHPARRQVDHEQDMKRVSPAPVQTSTEKKSAAARTPRCVRPWAARGGAALREGAQPARDPRRLGAARVVPALTAALATGTPLLLALTPACAVPDRVALDAVPARLRVIEVASGCAADYDAWLGAVAS